MGIRAVVVAHNDEALRGLVKILKSMDLICFTEGFTESDGALRAIEQNKPDIAVFEIGKRDEEVLSLAKKAKSKYSFVNIIFVAQSKEFAFEAMKLHASGYLIKPFTRQDLEYELKDLRFPPLGQTKPRIKVHCFGNFEVYLDGAACKFKYTKTKELLAYLIDRQGSNCTNGELLGALWEYREVTESLENYLRNLISDLKKVFADRGINDFIIKQRGRIRINPALVECDYYHFLSDSPGSEGDFYGEYMTQYSWAETTLAGIENMVRR